MGRSRFVYPAQMHCHTLENFYTIVKISEYMNQVEEVWEERFDIGWKQYERYDSWQYRFELYNVIQKTV